jgi:8-oxo-dGTP diphosphatase
VGVKAQGLSQDRYTVIPRVLIFPFASDGKVLLLKGAAHKRIWAGLWNGIGGHVEAGESVLQAAKRELQEETGLTAESLLFCGAVMVETQSNPGIAFFVYKAQGLSGKQHDSPEGNLRWFALDEIHQAPLVEDVPTLVGKVSRFQAGQQPFWGSYRYDANDQLVMSFEG